MDEQKKELKENQKKCGIVMPISPHPDYTLNHWKDVLNIITEAIALTTFKPSLVSDDEAIGLIHERIVTNIYNNEIVVCDVSSKNPNVMFELGLRLAFDKPIIIIKDDKTTYSFDTGLIEHLTYPSSLRFGEIVSFKKELSEKIEATYKRSIDTPDYSPFLKSFGKTIIPAKIQGTEVSETNYLIDLVKGIKDDLDKIKYEQKRSVIRRVYYDKSLELNKFIEENFNDILASKNDFSLNTFIQYVREKNKELPFSYSDEEITNAVEIYWKNLMKNKN